MMSSIHQPYEQQFNSNDVIDHEKNIKQMIYIICYGIIRR